MQVISSFLFLMFAGLTVFAQDYSVPPSPLQTFRCSPDKTNPATNCGDFKGSGQTFGSSPLLATMSASMIVGTGYNAENGEFDMIARMTINKISDPNNFYNASASVSVTASARICNYLRGCEWRQVDTVVVMDRPYGQREFDSSSSFDIHLSGNSGAEQFEVLAEMDLWLPNQQYPIVVKFPYQ